MFNNFQSNQCALFIRARFQIVKIVNPIYEKPLTGVADKEPLKNNIIKVVMVISDIITITLITGFKAIFITDSTRIEGD